VPRGVGDRAAAVEEAGADDAGNQDALSEEVVDNGPARAADRLREVAVSSCAQVLLANNPRLGLNGPLGTAATS